MSNVIDNSDIPNLLFYSANGSFKLAVTPVCSFSATTVGGGYINGTAESIASSGMVWTLAPFGIFIGLILGKIRG